MFTHVRKSTFGESMPTWLQTVNKILKRNFNRTKYDPLVEEIELIEPNLRYSVIHLGGGREVTVSNRHIAPSGEQVIAMLSREQCPSTYRSPGQDLAPQPSAEITTHAL